MPPSPFRPRPLAAAASAAMLATLLLAAFVRWQQARSSLVFDELASLYFADHPLRDLWGWWLVRETNPPLFYSLLRLWRMAVGEDPLALRLLPIALSLGHIALVGWLAARHYGRWAAAVAMLVLALSPSDVYQSAYLRGYVLARFAIAASFAGLLCALAAGDRAGDGTGRDGDGERLRGWLLYITGAVVAIYSHTTMLLWPAIAAAAVAALRLVERRGDRHIAWDMVLATLAIALLSGWEIWTVLAQMRVPPANIAWILPLSSADFLDSANLQLLHGEELSSPAVALLALIGAWRTRRERATRLAVAIIPLGLLAFKGADLLHPVTTDFTLHWCATFPALLAGAAFALPAARGRVAALALAATLGLAAYGMVALGEEGAVPRPQDWRAVVTTVARRPGAALLVSHESIGVVVTEACRVQFHRPLCPFPLVVMANPARSDLWAQGGYPGPLVAPREVRAALGAAREVFVFSRYVYTPLAPLGLDPGDYPETEWDDGELIGPVPIGDFSRPA